MRDFVAARHPLLAKLLGQPELVELVRRYIVAHPPDSCVATKVGARLARFLAASEPWCAQPILSELAAFDFLRSGAAISAEEPTVSRAELAEPDVTFRLKKRTALAITRFKFHAVPLTQLSRATPLDEHPTYVLVHMANRRTMTNEIDHRSYLAFELLAAGGTLRAVSESLHELALTDLEIESFLARCADADLLVAVGAA
jgi:hypothetical protein